MKKIILILTYILIASLVNAETIKLNSGNTFEGEIVERTDDYIKVDTGAGVNVTYYLDEIESINEGNGDEGQNNSIKSKSPKISYEDFSLSKTYVYFKAIVYEFNKWYKINKKYPTGLCDLKNDNPIQPEYRYVNKDTLPVTQCHEGAYGYQYNVVASDANTFLIVTNPMPGLRSEHTMESSFCVLEDGIVRIGENQTSINSRNECLTLPEYNASLEEKKEVEKLINERVDPLAELAKMIEQQTGKKVSADNPEELFGALFTTDAEQTFRKFIADPIPETVEISEGETFAWMDFKAHLIFKTDENTFKELSKEYGIISNDKFVGNLFKDEIMKNNKIVRYYKEKKSDERQYIKFYMFWDKDNSTVYFNAGNASYGNKSNAILTPLALGSQLEPDYIPDAPKKTDNTDISSSVIAILITISTASETYAMVNGGRYPVSMEDMINAKPPFITKNYCNEIIDGYKFECDLSEKGYNVVARPTTEDMEQTVYEISTGGILKP